jgi:hypothetical protein
MSDRQRLVVCRATAVVHSDHGGGHGSAQQRVRQCVAEGVVVAWGGCGGRHGGGRVLRRECGQRGRMEREFRGDAGALIF